MNRYLQTSLYAVISSLLIIPAGSISYGKNANIEALESVLGQLETYEFGETESWKPKLLEVVRSIYQDETSQRTARVRLNDFLNSQASEEAKLVISEELRLLTADSIPLPEARELLNEAESLLTYPKETTEKLLSVAERLESLGKAATAARIYDSLRSHSNDFMIQVAALNGAFRVSQHPVEFWRTEIPKVTPKLRRHAIRLIRDLPDDFQNGVIFFKESSLNDADKCQLLILFAERNDSSVHATAYQFLKGNRASLRSAALAAMEHLGNPSDIALLIETASKASEPESALARKALYRMPGEAVDVAILEALPGSSFSNQVELIKAVEERAIPNASKALLKCAQSADESVRIQALKVLATTTDLSNLEDLVVLHTRSEEPKTRREIERTLLRIATRFPEDSRGERSLQAQLQATSNEATRNALIEILNNLEKTTD